MLNLKNLKNIVYKNEIQVGDWIYMENYKGEYYIAYLTSITKQTIDVFITDFLDENGKLKKKLNKSMRYVGWSDFKIWIDKTEFSINDLEDKTSIINLTLDLKDKDWFNELANQEEFKMENYEFVEYIGVAANISEFIFYNVIGKDEE